MHSIIGIDSITSSSKILFTSNSLIEAKSRLEELSNEILGVVLDNDGNELIIPYPHLTMRYCNAA